MTNLDPTLAFTALINLWPGFRQLDVRDGDPLVRELAAAMTQDNPRDRWAFARQWIAERPYLYTITCCQDIRIHKGVEAKCHTCGSTFLASDQTARA